MNSIGILGLVLIFSSVLGGVRAQGKVTAHTGQIELPTYPWAAVRHPYFRGTDNVNIYPYPMLDFLSREKTNRTYRTVVLENEYLRIMFLPELGGKIYDVLDKTTGQPMFYVNHVVKPGLIAQCGAWTSGGVEWNTGPQGHTVSCLQPVPVLILPPEKDGSQSVAIGETERIYGTHWTVIVTLRPGRAFIDERIRIYNPTETIRPYYFWNCTAAPNTPGFRFIYPMTLGCDHAGEKFFHWPIDHGKDLSYGTNYQDASSIFAWHCDQDFFGSYNDDLDHGAVSYANHHQLPGKKAWTWGYGGFGQMHQADLTDDDGPYNEVQTGPLLTQAQVGQLDPCEAVEWKEWWYPIHGIGGFAFANKNVAVNASRQGAKLKLALIGTAEWKSAEVSVAGASNPKKIIASQQCRLSPRQPMSLSLALPQATAQGEPLMVQIRAGGEPLASFRFPLDLPVRTPPEKKPAPQTASEFAEKGWQHLLFAQFKEAEGQFRKALELDPKSASAKTGLALLRLDSDPAQAAESAAAALETEPDSGLAHYALAVAQDRAGHSMEALDEAWKASLDPTTAVAARGLVAKLDTRTQSFRKVIEALCEPGPWQTDPLCRNRLALAYLEVGDRHNAARLANQNLAVDPLDPFARSVLWLARAEPKGLGLQELLRASPHGLEELVADYSDLLRNDQSLAQRLLEEFYFKGAPYRQPLLSYWAAQVCDHQGTQSTLVRLQRPSADAPADDAFPYRREAIPVLRAALEHNPNDGRATLYLGDLLFHLGRYADGRELWRRAADLGVEPVLACRALGMAAKTLDGDLKMAREWLDKANTTEPGDAIVARDLAKVLFDLADQADGDSAKQQLLRAARDRLKAALPQGKTRSDFVALLARAQNRLGDFAETARLLDTVRVTVWEGSHEIHDLFEQAHLALGEAELKAGRPAEALVQFNRALEYPANLATGKLENAHEAHIQYQRGNALAALSRKTDAVTAWKTAANEPESSDSRIQEARQKAKEALEKAHP